MTDSKLAASWPGATIPSKFWSEPPRAPKVRPSAADFDVPWLELPSACGKDSPMSCSTFFDEDAESCSEDWSPRGAEDEEVFVFPMEGVLLSDAVEAEEERWEQSPWSFQYQMLGLADPEVFGCISPIGTG